MPYGISGHNIITMESIKTDYISAKYDDLQTANNKSQLRNLREQGFQQFNKAGLPHFKNEEWKYTFISNLFRKEYHIYSADEQIQINSSDLDGVRLPGHEMANELVFVNGKYNPKLSIIRSPKDALTVLSLEDAMEGEYKDLVNAHINKSSQFIKDGIHALNTSFINDGIFVMVQKNAVLEHPIYLYHVSDTRNNHTLSQPRSLFYVDQGAKVQIAENFHTIGAMDSLNNEVIEIVANTNAIVEYYKIQNDSTNASHVGTTHIRQIGKCYVHTVTISLDGDMIRNNIDIIMEAAANEAHMYGLYLLKGRTHVDNHTLVDNTLPNCFSNELYKGVIDDSATGVFSGKIFVRPDAQKTNAYQSNKNILLSETGTVNTKPQLEIFADDVKCSHGCTIGQLDEDAMYYLRTRGIGKEHARAILLNAFAEDIVGQIKIKILRDYVSGLIGKRLMP